MLPSWNNLLSKMAVKPVGRLGIAVGKTHIAAAHVVPIKDGSVDIRWSSQQALPHELFHNQPTPEVQSALSDSISTVCGKLQNSFIPIQVAIADPVMTFRIFELDSLPVSPKERDALVRWQFSKALHINADEISCVHQYLGKQNDKHLLLGVIISTVWLQCIKSAFSDNNLIISLLDMAASYRFNRFHDVLTKEGASGTLVSIDAESWTQHIWDTQGRPRLIMSRWRESHTPDREIENIALEVERIVRAYTHADDGDSIERVYLSGADSKLSDLAASLESNMDGHCIALETDHGLASSSDSASIADGIIATALAAGLPR